MANRLDAFYSLFRKTNKAQGEEFDIGNPIPELELSMSDEELIELTEAWEQNWNKSKLKSELSQIWEENEDYWKGKHLDKWSDDRPLIDNLVFEALETFLPVATRKNPEPMVQSDNSDAGNVLAKSVRQHLVYHADRLKFKLTLKTVARFWGMYHLGPLKVGWSEASNDISTVALRPQKLILDPDATIDKCIYTGDYIGERKRDKASTLMLRFPKKSSYIKELVGDNEATEIQYIEWWTDDYVCWTHGKEVLAKAKNPHWNYISQETVVDEFGMETTQELPGMNHFEAPRKPYIFLSVFNVGKHPFDDTSLIQQNLAKQDLINKRLRQIDKNADNTNGGIVVSGEAFTKEQAQEVGKAVRLGGTIFVPGGKTTDAVNKLPNTNLPEFIYTQLVDTRNAVRDSYGVRGSSPQGTVNEETVRGKILIKGQDESRIGLISEYLEQVADEVFNWWVQLMYVNYDEPHTVSVMGKEMATEYYTLVNSDLLAKLTVSVKEGSLIPKDPLAKRNEAIELWGAGAIDPISLYERLEDPNPRERALQLLMWQQSPMMLFPELQQMMMQQAMLTGVPPGQPGQEQPGQQQGAQPQETDNPAPLNQVPLQ